MNPIKVTGLSKSFGKKTVLTDINLTIEPNTIYGLLGRNGAGKSTLLNLITNRLPIATGTVTIDGTPLANNDALLNRIYMMSEANLYPPRLRVSEIFKLTAQMYQGFDAAYADELVAKFELDPQTRFNKLSTGYRSVMKLIIALAVDVDYVFLDEPTLGLDANHRQLFYEELIDSYAKTPRSFVISTHLIEEIANVIERVFVIQDHQLLVNDTTENVLQEGYAVTGPAKEVQTYTADLNVIGQESLGNLLVHYVYGQLDDQREIPDTVTVSHIDLQKLFIYLTSQGGHREI
ncbi:multidrug ABC transporter ATP-binding protein [Secundilactobacillus paracollinoides]|uniref:Multidrug ABC transporter ATP-binding protein n=1 Tax=Secundilactobacillus paracollinoides TaxID=240427 RepID=A0A1B2IZY8_9LACO|nr:ABC transporter ATP-binding protein [Secundilactobacillus paracollinoides]ANZ61695.1 multidrug ABC transporter ATP-binding protein [Secundilactobacillus paracollinoides]ANZ63331.1 multidrug ABC transporter ATP-binding protein [Secundilactobacillus paracollinoides]ANZ67613.1 multidrug ABC transporter ATP-binding protein [Secundilactobacillus paracollinoides]